MMNTNVAARDSQASASGPAPSVSLMRFASTHSPTATSPTMGVWIMCSANHHLRPRIAEQKEIGNIGLMLRDMLIHPRTARKACRMKQLDAHQHHGRGDKANPPQCLPDFYVQHASPLQNEQPKIVASSSE